MKLKIISFLFLGVQFLNAQWQTHIFQLQWNENIMRSKNPSIDLLDFQNSIKLPGKSQLPVFNHSIIRQYPGNSKIKLLVGQEHILTIDSSSIQGLQSFLTNDYQIRSQEHLNRGHFQTDIELVPLRILNHHQLAVLLNFNIEEEYIPMASPLPLPEFKRTSVLANGIWHKISVPGRGLYKISKSFFTNQLKIDPKNLDPRKIQLFGNGGKMLPESTNDTFIDDLEENAIYFKGESDGVFDDNDYLLFYASGPDTYRYNTSTEDYTYRKNIYADESVYFLRIDGTVAGKRIASINSASPATYQSNGAFDFVRHENDLVNLLELDPGGEGSGKDWYGEELSNTREYDFGNQFIIDHTDLNRAGKFSFAFAGRAPVSQPFFAEVEGTRVLSSISPVAISSLNRFANLAIKTSPFQPVSDLIKAKIQYPTLTGVSSEGWLDFFQISVWKKLIWNLKPLYLLDPESRFQQITSYTIDQVNSPLFIWDITEPLDIKHIQGVLQPGSKYVFASNTQNALKEFVAWDENNTFPSPNYLGPVANQNLHSLDQLDMLIVYHKDFEKEAERLAEHRKKINQINIAVVEIGKIYNEFSSGSQDPTAIRNMCRMLYLRHPGFKYLLLFGDGSYDLRHRNKKDPDQNFIVTYQTDESIDPIFAYPSDDYFGLLDPAEGKDLEGQLDIGIGRLCARNTEESKNLVDKIIRYDTDPKTLGDWKMNILFSADDEDSNVHFGQAEIIAKQTSVSQPVFNQEKIYLDAYQQVTTPGGERYPEVNKAISDAFFKGTLVMNYLGHGGYTGLAQERIFQNTEIPSLDNYYKLPLVIVASCTFNGFDDPSKTNAGEEGIHSTLGGFLALFSTVRAVYSDDNFDLTSSVYKYLFNFENGLPLPMGEIMRRAKNEHSNSNILDNSRKFLLFGDPSQRLAIPLLKNQVSHINGKPIGTSLDTFRALETVEVKGMVTDQNDQLKSDFNGKLFITVFDKEIQLRTKANDPGSFSENYPIQKNIIYKGQVSVNQGHWSFQFKIPADINYSFGMGKISLYATDEISQDAAGYESRLIIGGSSRDSLKDNNPPVVKVFINNNQFIFGSICGPDPKIYAEISDDNGINISGNSIGHDLIAVLDNQIQYPIILNQNFTASLNNPLEGTVLYPLNNLSPGKHSITVTAWDISNNFGSGTVEFIVVDENEVRLENVGCFPNPFNNETKFQFNTNWSVPEMDIEIDIRSLSGQPVRTIRQKIQNNGFRVVSIPWDGTSTLGAQVPSGLYIYRIQMEFKQGEDQIKKSSDFQKLILVK